MVFHHLQKPWLITRVFCIFGFGWLLAGDCIFEAVKQALGIEPFMEAWYLRIAFLMAQVRVLR
jgi:hypothetical protein